MEENTAGIKIEEKFTGFQAFANEALSIYNDATPKAESAYEELKKAVERLKIIPQEAECFNPAVERALDRAKEATQASYAEGFRDGYESALFYIFGEFGLHFESHFDRELPADRE